MNMDLPGIWTWSGERLRFIDRNRTSAIACVIDDCAQFDCTSTDLKRAIADGSLVRITDDGKDGEGSLVESCKRKRKREERPTQCPTTGCYNDLLPDQTECEPCRVARIEFDSAGFSIRANYYADGVCIECGETVEAGDYCHEHAQDHVPEDVKAMSVRKSAPMTHTGCHNPECPSYNEHSGEPCATCEADEYELAQAHLRGHSSSNRDGDGDCHSLGHPTSINMNPYRSRIVATILALLLAFTTHTTHAAPYTPTAPVGCHITHFWQDDLSAIAVCIGGYTITKEDGPTDTWNDVLYATGVMLVGPDANGQYHEYTTFD